MRNLKKFLALVLSLMMVMSLMVTVNASSFTDKSSITGTYVEAVDVLDGLKVLQGYSDGSFNPKGNITRGQMAAIIYRIMTGDVAGNQVSIYADWNRFADVPSNDWSAGYVNFCANAELIKGVGNGNFRPYNNVTGYQVLAMVLRAIGYGEKQYNGVGEFEGTGWEIRTASRAKLLGITNNINEGTLAQPATREMVAEIVFRALQTPMVNYTILQDYQPQVLVENTKENREIYGSNAGLLPICNTLMYQTFTVVGKQAAYGRDAYGRPSTVWLRDGANDTVQAGTKYVVAGGDTQKFAIAFTPVKTYYTEVSECQLTKDVNNDNSIAWSAITEFVNGCEVINRTLADYVADGDANATTGLQAYKASRDNLVLDALHTEENTIGATGRTTEIYRHGNTWTFVYIDNLLGVVTDKTERTLDTAGHVMFPATLTINMNNTTDIVVGSNTNFDNYKVGDLLLLNTYGYDNVPVKDNANAAGATKVASEIKTLANGKLDAAGTGSEDDTAEIRGVNTSKLVNNEILQAVPSVRNDFYATVNGSEVSTVTLIGKPTEQAVTVRATVSTSNTYATGYDNRGGIQGTDGRTYMANHGYLANGNGTGNKLLPFDADNDRVTVPDNTRADYFIHMINECIGKDYTLYLFVAPDGSSSVVGMTEAKAETNIGVITSLETNVRVGAGKFVIEAEMYMVDGSTKTVRFIKGRNSATPYDYFHLNEDMTDGDYTLDDVYTGDASADLEDTNLGLNSLVKIKSVVKDGQTYYVVMANDENATGSTAGNVGSSADYTSAAPLPVHSTGDIVTGVSNTLVADHSDIHVSDTTKFIFASEDYYYNVGWGSNVGGKANMGYNHFDGFKNIPTAIGTDVKYQIVDDTVYVHPTFTPDQNGSGDDNITGTFTSANYGLKGKEKVAVDESYLILAPIATYAEYSSYKALKNGVETVVNISNANQTLNQKIEQAMDNAQLIVLDSVNLKGYATVITVLDGTENAASNVDNRNHTIDADKWVYYNNDSVLMVSDADDHNDTSNNPFCLTLADNCRIQIVNLLHGTFVEGTQANIMQYENYNPTGGALNEPGTLDSHRFVYELDADGYVCNLYIID